MSSPQKLVDYDCITLYQPVSGYGSCQQQQKQQQQRQQDQKTSTIILVTFKVAAGSFTVILEPYDLIDLDHIKYFLV